VFPCHPLECSAIHLAASCSVTKPLITSVSPSGHRISIPQPVPGFFRAMKVGRCSNIRRICAHGASVQASNPATIKLPHYPAFHILLRRHRTRQLAPCFRVPEPRPATISRVKPAGVPAAIDGPSITVRWGRFLLATRRFKAGHPARPGHLPAAQPNRHNRGDQKHRKDCALADAAHSRTSYSNATPSESFS
jgi:hypothetical protein